MSTPNYTIATFITFLPLFLCPPKSFVSLNNWAVASHIASFLQQTRWKEERGDECVTSGKTFHLKKMSYTHTKKIQSDRMWLGYCLTSYTHSTYIWRWNWNLYAWYSEGREVIYSIIDPLINLHNANENSLFPIKESNSAWASNFTSRGDIA